MSKPDDQVDPLELTTEEYIQYLHKQIFHLRQCCNFDANGKSVPLGSTLYAINHETGEVMTLKVPEATNYCWYLTIEDARDAAGVKL